MEQSTGTGSTLSKLACIRCQTQKIRCNRALPACDRCESKNLDCAYRDRAKRKSKRKAVGVSSALTAILNRLERLEQPDTTSSPESTDATRSSPRQISPAASTPSFVVPTIDTPSIAAPTVGSTLDTVAILTNAIGQIERLRLYSFSLALVSDPVDIPPELAKAWIQNYFTFKRTAAFLSLVDRKLIENIPDILHHHHVHIDPVVLVLYFCILYQGCTLQVGRPVKDREIDYLHAAYAGCLRSLAKWSRRATGTTTEFVAALFLTMVAGENFDFRTAWEMYEQTCSFARGLNLDKLDEKAGQGLSCSDEDRRGFWQLVQIDLFFRLIYDVPPNITATHWKVNLPWVGQTSLPPPDDMQTTFLISSRITMVLIQFFSVIQKPVHRSEDTLRREVDNLCQEIFDLYEEWQLNERFMDSAAPEKDFWDFAGLLWLGYTAIIFMSHRLATSDLETPQCILQDADIPDSWFVLEASRRLLRVFLYSIERYPHAELMPAVLGGHKGYLPIAIVHNAVIAASELDSTVLEDLKLLMKLYGFINETISGVKEYFPLGEVLKVLIKKLKARQGI